MDDIKFVLRLRDTDFPGLMPDYLYEQLVEIVEKWQSGIPVIHELKKMMERDPVTIPEVGFELAAVYYNNDELLKAEQWADKILAVSPDFIEAVNLKFELLLEKEDYDAAELLVDTNMPIEKKFSGRRIFSINEYCNYEINAIRWLLINELNEPAVKRSYSLISVIQSRDDAFDFYGYIFKAFADYVPDDELTPEISKLLEELVRLNDFE